MSGKKIIYIPTLHQELIPADLPGCLTFLRPGLPEKEQGASGYCPPDLPFAPGEAAGVLREMLELGYAFGKSGDLRLLAGQGQLGGPGCGALGWLERENAYKEKLRQEKRSLDEFARSGQTESGPTRGGNAWSRANALGDPGATTMAEQFKNAQKILLLAWELEKNLLEIRAAELAVQEKTHLLKQSLADPSLLDPCPMDLSPMELRLDDLEDEPSPAGPQNFSLESPGGMATPSWRIILDAAGAFLPEGSVLFSCHQGMLEDLREAGMLQPLPGDLLELCADFPPEVTAGLLLAHGPLWRLLGYARVPQDRPWLEASYELLLATRLRGG
ncbi:hypothetical protein LJC36_02975 [Desulfovibrio sp. OttesenSCG-928-C14]|nr:hypothetical protein [Desulfovibrio sp. OttesenSCG-928-C14]